MDTKKIILLVVICCVFLHCTDAATTAYGACQAECVTVVISCYAGAGLGFGSMTAGAVTPTVIGDCNTAHGTCQSACWAALIETTP